ncbi:RNA polymerase sigma factor [Gordonia sp. CPCC 206044]|uniref:RNA polymerase sigma factor n=1 Tax=Gordonia sp. CPCC 206044 TaxID=3140793 RepID=UPI003AF3868B
MDSESARGDSRNPGHSTGLSLGELTDDHLAAAAAVGDEEAFGVLVHRMSPVLLRYLRRMVADPQIAEDLAQETLLHAWKGLPDFGFRSSFRTWMFTIAHRKTVDHWRKRRDVPADDEQFADLAHPGPLPAEEVERSTLIEALRSELGNLPPTSRAAWWLKEVEGLSLEEISRILQISTGSVRGHLQRSRKFLSTRLSPWRPGSGSAPPAAAGDTPIGEPQTTAARGGRA